MAKFGQFLLILFIACMFPGSADGAILTCGEFQIEVPDTWEKLSLPPPIHSAFGATDSDAFLCLTFSPFSPAPTQLSDKRVKEFMQGMKKRASKLLLEAEATIAGRPAIHLDFEALTPNGTSRILVWNVLARTGIYSAMLVNVSEPAMKQTIIDSAKLIESADPPELPEDVRLREKIYDLAIYLVIALVAFAYFMKPRTHKPA